MNPKGSGSACPLPGEIPSTKCARVGLIPLIPNGSWDPVNGKKQVEIRRFAAFYLLGVQGSKNDVTITGAFLRYVEAAGPTVPGGPLEGTLGVMLWR